MLLYSRDVPTGWIALFRGGLELELRVDCEKPIVWWSTIRGPAFGHARWGLA